MSGPAQAGVFRYGERMLAISLAVMSSYILTDGRLSPPLLDKDSGAVLALLRRRDSLIQLGCDERPTQRRAGPFATALRGSPCIYFGRSSSGRLLG